MSLKVLQSVQINYEAMEKLRTMRLCQLFTLLAAAKSIK
jgi:hypothetical protein